MQASSVAMDGHFDSQFSGREFKDWESYVYAFYDGSESNIHSSFNVHAEFTSAIAAAQDFLGACHPMGSPPLVYEHDQDVRLCGRSKQCESPNLEPSCLASLGVDDINFPSAPRPAVQERNAGDPRLMQHGYQTNLHNNSVPLVIGGSFAPWFQELLVAKPPQLAGEPEAFSQYPRNLFDI